MDGWFGPRAQPWYILAGLSLVVGVLLFPQTFSRTRIYQLGDVAGRDVKAVQEFLVENRELSEKNRQEAVKLVLSVYDFEQTAIPLRERLREAFAAGRALLAVSLAEAEPEKAPQALESTAERPKPDRVAIRSQFFDQLGIEAEEGTFEVLYRNGFPPAVESAVTDLLTGVMRNGVVSSKAMLLSQGGKGIMLQDIGTERESVETDPNRFLDLREAQKIVLGHRERLAQELGGADLARAATELAFRMVEPNITFNKRETELRKEAARQSAKPFYFKVKKGEMILREGERVGPEHLLKLTEQQKHLSSSRLIGRVPAMAVLIGLLLAGLYLVGILQNRASTTGNKDLLFLAVTLLTVFLGVLAADLVSEETARGITALAPAALAFAIPVASGAMLVAVFLGVTVATGFSLVAALLASFVLDGRPEIFVYFFVSSLVAAHGVHSCRERGIFIRTGLRVSITNLVLALAIQALDGPLYSLETLIAALAAVSGGILVGVITTGILPLVEMAFGYTSDIKLLELANLDQPLLRELMVSAPGTYHHSVVVSNMVEASAQAINANPLLARVAAYYHDIGKTSKPLYFIENQMDRENKHERLAPSMSSLILISHVKDGVELARKQKLGREIVDIIRQHHGTSLITYFYEKAKEQKEKKGGKSVPIKEEDFRYPGPKPQTKEAGLVMLADVVEAAAKTIPDPTAARIQGMVQKIINKIFSDGQLDECELTLKDLNAIAKSFNKTLSGILHHRIDYPEPVFKVAAARKRTNGSPDQVSGAEPVAKKSAAKEEARESLKRLGLS